MSVCNQQLTSRQKKKRLAYFSATIAQPRFRINKKF